MIDLEGIEEAEIRERAIIDVLSGSRLARYQISTKLFEVYHGHELLLSHDLCSLRSQGLIGVANEGKIGDSFFEEGRVYKINFGRPKFGKYSFLKRILRCY